MDQSQAVPNFRASWVQGAAQSGSRLTSYAVSTDAWAPSPTSPAAIELDFRGVFGLERARDDSHFALGALGNAPRVTAHRFSCQ